MVAVVAHRLQIRPIRTLNPPREVLTATAQPHVRRCGRIACVDGQRSCRGFGSISHCWVLLSARIHVAGRFAIFTLTLCSLTKMGSRPGSDEPFRRARELLEGAGGGRTIKGRYNLSSTAYGQGSGSSCFRLGTFREGWQQRRIAKAIHCSLSCRSSFAWLVNDLSGEGFFVRCWRG